MRHRGFSIVEIVLAALFLLLLIGAATSAIARDHVAHRTIIGQYGPEMRAQHTLERIAAELRMAGEWAEDRDHDGALDDGEDTNENGDLDADWNLADGATDQDSLSFNRRIDLRTPEGELVASGVYTRRVAYVLEQGHVVREWDASDEEGNVQTQRAIVAVGIAGLRFSRSGTLVTVSLDYDLPTDIYAPGRRTVTTRVWLRN